MKFFKRSFVALVCLLVLSNAIALAQSKPVAKQAVNHAAAASSQAPPQIKYEKYRLKNGLDVILSQDHRLPLVAVNLWYHVGPANERPGRTGFAHLFEHMMFEGSKHIGSKAHFRYLESAGASDINGTTDFDRTNYFETLPSNQLELALWLESDRMGYLLDTLDEEKLANQRDVVRNERRQSVENAPYGLVEEEVYHHLFPKDHPYYADVIGSHADVEAARLKDVREFFTQYYSPNNASLAIVGDFDPVKTKALVDEYFGSIPAGTAVPKIAVKTPAITSERRSAVTDQVELPRVYMAWITPEAFTPGDADADLLAQLLGAGKSSRLYKKLVYEKQIAQDVFAYNQSLKLGSVLLIGATVKPGVKPEDLEKEINAELEALRTQGPTRAEVERARNTIESRMITRLETLGGFGGVADRLNEYNQFLGDPGFLPKDLQRYDNATPASVKQVADKYLRTNQRVVVYGVPGKKVIEDVPKTTAQEEQKEKATENVVGRMPDEAWRAQPPKPAPASAMSLPVPASFKLGNGLTVLLVERHNLPIVTASLVALSGSEANPVDKPGLAAFTAAMLQEGTTHRPALRIADDAAQLGATLSTNSTADASGVTIQSLKKTADGAFELFSDVALHPAFDQKEIDRIRSRRVTAILQERDDPGSLARKAMYRVLYGSQHPYGYVELGTAESVKSISRDDMLRFYQAGYAPGNSALLLAGDLTEAEARSLAEKYFVSWTGQGSKHAPVPVENKVTRSIVIIDKPDAPQTALRIASVGVPRSNPEYVPLEVMNTAFGGLFSSRINMNLREQHGYTYGAFSTFVFRRGPGPFVAGSDVRTDATGPAVSELFKELDRIRTAPISNDELVMSKGNFAQSLAGLFETSRQTVNGIASLFLYDLPLDYYRTLPGKIDAVTAADVQRVAQKYLIPDNMVVVAVGDRAKIEPELRNLNAGPIEVLDYDANPVKAAAAAGK